METCTRPRLGKYAKTSKLVVGRRFKYEGCATVGVTVSATTVIVCQNTKNDQILMII